MYFNSAKKNYLSSLVATVVQRRTQPCSHHSMTSSAVPCYFIFCVLIPIPLVCDPFRHSVIWMLILVSIYFAASHSSVLRRLPPRTQTRPLLVVHMNHGLASKDEERFHKVHRLSHRIHRRQSDNGPVHIVHLHGEHATFEHCALEQSTGSEVSSCPSD